MYNLIVLYHTHKHKIQEKKYLIKTNTWRKGVLNNLQILLLLKRIEKKKIIQILDWTTQNVNITLKIKYENCCALIINFWYKLLEIFVPNELL